MGQGTTLCCAAYIAYFCHFELTRRRQICFSHFFPLPPSERKQLKIRANRFRCFLKERPIRKEDEDGGYASREPQRSIRQTSVRCLYYSHARRQPANHAGLG